MAFNNAHNFGIGPNATFNISQNTHTLLPADPAEILRQARAVEASHTSSTAGYAPKCTPETRQRVVADIADWVQVDATPTSILWLSGPAGAGKTCVMRDVVECCEIAGLTATSYFFSKGSGLTDERRFVATIVHQLVSLDPVLKPIVYNAIRDRPTVFEESPDFQMRKLVVEPMQSPAYWSQSPSPPKIVIAIDGLDECGEEREREHLLNMMGSLVNKLPHLIVVVIASRPEFDLRRAFDDPNLKNITKFLRLQDYDGTKDIRLFLHTEFARIRATHPLGHSISENWPLEEIILVLLEKSSGNFIYPATVIKYIKNSRRNPADSLDIILGLAPLPSIPNPFVELDALYSLILHPPDTDLGLMKRILHCILGMTSVATYRNPGYTISSSFLDTFLGLPPNTTATTLCDLHSLLFISDAEPIKFHHKSLEDYLLDPRRSLDFFQSLSDTHLDLTMVCTMHLTHWGGSLVVNQPLRYSSLQWSNHLRPCIDHKPISKTLPDTIMDADPRTILEYRLLHGIDLSDYGYRSREALHAALCSEHNCVRLCQLLTRINDCAGNFDKFNDFDIYDFKGRREALPKFISETGLYKRISPKQRATSDDSWNDTPVFSQETDISPPDRQAQFGRTASQPEARPRNHLFRRLSFEGEESHAPPNPSPPPPPGPPNPARRMSKVDRFRRRFKRWLGVEPRSPS